jgi:hypothetical protein
MNDLYQDDFASSDLPSCWYDYYLDMRTKQYCTHSEAYLATKQEMEYAHLLSSMGIP